MLLFNLDKSNVETIERSSKKKSVRKARPKIKSLKSKTVKKQRKLTKVNKDFLKSLTLTLKQK